MTDGSCTLIDQTFNACCRGVYVQATSSSSPLYIWSDFECWHCSTHYSCVWSGQSASLFLVALKGKKRSLTHLVLVLLRFVYARQMLLITKVSQYCLLSRKFISFTYRGNAYLRERSDDYRKKRPRLGGELASTCNSRRGQFILIVQLALSKHAWH